MRSLAEWVRTRGGNHGGLKRNIRQWLTASRTKDMMAPQNAKCPATHKPLVMLLTCPTKYKIVQTRATTFPPCCSMMFMNILNTLSTLGRPSGDLYSSEPSSGRSDHTSLANFDPRTIEGGATENRGTNLGLACTSQHLILGESLFPLLETATQHESIIEEPRIIRVNHLLRMNSTRIQSTSTH